MDTPFAVAVTPLRQRMLDDMRMRKLEPKTQAYCATHETARMRSWPNASWSAWRRRCRPSIQAPRPACAKDSTTRLTLQGLSISGALYRTLRTTNPIENLNGSIAGYTSNVKRWRDGQMVQRWVASALSDASQRFRALRGFRDMPHLIAALNERVTSVDIDQRKAARHP